MNTNKDEESLPSTPPTEKKPADPVNEKGELQIGTDDLKAFHQLLMECKTESEQAGGSQQQATTFDPEIHAQPLEKIFAGLLDGPKLTEEQQNKINTKFDFPTDEKGKRVPSLKEFLMLMDMVDLLQNYVLYNPDATIDPYVAFPKRLLAADLSGPAIKVYLALRLHLSPSKAYVFPSVAKIAERCGWVDKKGKPNTRLVNRAIAELVDQRVIHRERRFNDSSRTYFLIPHTERKNLRPAKKAKGSFPSSSSFSSKKKS